ncbi:Uncharacterised protein [uncultured archaeon]|nr:Uncharacterised protein [uncultured archaeon]
MEYKFNPKMQAAYGAAGFLSSLLLLYLLLSRLEWITALTVGIGNFIIAGFYTDYCCKK